jgi:glycerol uptake facilitator-like aquaporin
MSETTGVSYFIATSLALTLGAVVLLFWSVSGAHVNPAITFGMWTARKMGTLRAVGYIAAQLLGGLAAWQLYEYLTDRALPAKTVAFSTPVLVAEIIGTAILAMGFAAAVTRKAEAGQAAALYGLAIFAGTLVAAIAAAAYLNPALALGLRSWSSVYVLGPLVGGLVGVNLYVWLFGPDAVKLAKRVSKK